jgi:signal transduction histidine kinase
MVEEALEIVRLAGHKRTFDVQVQEEVGQVRGDRYELLLVLVDLLSNAAAHSPEAGVVRVKVTVEDGVTGFAVADEGPGIPEEMVDDVFTPFYLMKDPGRRGARGTGLGLCHGKQIVEAHGGRIWVESAPGEGTTVRFEIPA